MSVRIMAALWDMPGLSPVEKLVMLALADWANDDGECWPSIKQIADKTGCGERTVQRAFRAAEDMGILKRHEVAGKGNRYTINPRHADTPVTETPPPHRRVTPATLAPNTSEHINTFPNGKDKTRAKPEKPKAEKVERPDDVGADLWADFLRHRKTKRAIITARVLKDFREQAHEVGWTLERAMQESITRGWQSFKAEWVKDKSNGTANRTGSQVRDTRDGLARYLDERIDADRRRQAGATNDDCPSAFALIADNSAPAVRSDDANIFHLTPPIQGRC